MGSKAIRLSTCKEPVVFEGHRKQFQGNANVVSVSVLRMRWQFWNWLRLGCLLLRPLKLPEVWIRLTTPGMNTDRIAQGWGQDKRIQTPESQLMCHLNSQALMKLLAVRTFQIYQDVWACVLTTRIYGESYRLYLLHTWMCAKLEWGFGVNYSESLIDYICLDCIYICRYT